MAVRNIMLWLHIAAAIIILGGLTFSAMIVPGMVRGGREYLPALRRLHGIGKVFEPTTVIIFLLGVGLVFKNDWKFSHLWISLSIALFFIAAFIGAVPTGRTLTTAIGKISDGHPADAEASRLGMLGGINILLLLTIVYLMVAKPGGIG